MGCPPEQVAARLAEFGRPYSTIAYVPVSSRGEKALEARCGAKAVHVREAIRLASPPNQVPSIIGDCNLR